MSPEPQREIEKELLAYKQRRRQQLGVAMELHPATCKMLLAEAARAASRPLLTSEEAAKNFVRSFVMSNQKQGFFARHKRRVIWGGAMFACLAVVLAVLRNDPRLAEQRRAFPDALPAPQPAKPQATTAAVKLLVESEQLVRARQIAPATDKVQELTKNSAVPVGNPSPASPRGATVAAAPTTVLTRETLDRRSLAAPGPSPTINMPTAATRAASAPAPTSGPAVAKAESAVSLGLVRDLDRKLEEKGASGELAQLTKSLKTSQATGGVFEPEVKKLSEVEAKLKRSTGDEMKRAPLATAAVGGGADAATAPTPFAASGPQVLSAFATTDNSQAQQRFLQLDNQAGYRKNFNSPPLPQVMQDFAFERTGDRVRIVDQDGSTYVGTVIAAPAEENRAKAISQFDAVKQLKDAPALEAKAAEPQSSYRFIANGVNRKLNQSVEFRGEWQPGAPVQTSQALPALQPVSLGVVRLEVQALEKKEKAVMTNALAEQAVPAKANLFFQQQQNESAQGRISGRVVVGGKNEFEINAVPK